MFSTTWGSEVAAKRRLLLAPAAFPLSLSTYTHYDLRPLIGQLVSAVDAKQENTNPRARAAPDAQVEKLTPDTGEIGPSLTFVPLL